MTNLKLNTEADVNMHLQRKHTISIGEVKLLYRHKHECPPATDLCGTESENRALL